MVYQKKPGSRVKADANIIGQVLEKLDKTGGVTAKRLVNVSRPEDAPLHKEFEWDDLVAAENYREYQARHIIGSITVKREPNDNRPPVRAFQRIKLSEGDGGNYYRIDTIKENEIMMEALLNQSYRDMMAFVDKYETLAEIANVTAEMKKTILTRKTGRGVHHVQPVR